MGTAKVGIHTHARAARPWPSTSAMLRVMICVHLRNVLIQSC